jgi:hypothetical protein
MRGCAEARSRQMSYATKICWKEQVMSTTEDRQRINTQKLDDLDWMWAVKLAEMDRREYGHKPQEQARNGSSAGLHYCAVFGHDTI